MLGAAAAAAVLAGCAGAQKNPQPEGRSGAGRASAKACPPQRQVTCPPCKKPRIVPKVAKRTVMLVGDSIMVGMEPFIEEHYYDTDTLILPFARVSTGLTTPGFYDWDASLTKFAQYVRPELIVINIGTNDFKVVGEQKEGEERWDVTYRQLVQNIIDIAVAVGSKLVWVSPPVMGKASLNSSVIQINRVIRDVCERNKVPYVDLSDVLTDENGHYTRYMDIDGNRETIRFKDGIHVTKHGNRILIRPVVGAIDEALGGK